MNTFYIIANQMKETCTGYMLQIQKYLEERGKICYIHGEETGETPAPHEMYKYTNAAQIPSDVECVLVLGGDGTLLQASRDLLRRDIPLLGINIGTLGYLAEIEIANVEEALDRLIAGEYSIENRMMLSGSVYRNDKRLIEDVALNDIVVSRRGHLRVVDFNVYVNQTFLCAYRADWIILSTATGSTGYMLSAGGPIVAPDASLILLTAIAPHTLVSRPIVLPDDDEVMVEIGVRSVTEQDGAEVVFDGDTSLSLRSGDRIRVIKSDKQTRLVKINNTSFVELLRRKLN